MCEQHFRPIALSWILCPEIQRFSTGVLILQFRHWPALQHIGPSFYFRAHITAEDRSRYCVSRSKSLSSDCCAVMSFVCMNAAMPRDQAACTRVHLPVQAKNSPISIDDVIAVGRCARLIYRAVGLLYVLIDSWLELHKLERSYQKHRRYFGGTTSAYRDRTKINRESSHGVQTSVKAPPSESLSRWFWEAFPMTSKRCINVEIYSSFICVRTHIFLVVSAVF